MSPRSTHPGFTLVELLIVVIILAILATVAIPRFASTSLNTKCAALEANLTVLRKSIELYHTEHNDTYPGTIAAVKSWTNFVAHMTTRTDVKGQPGTDFGPYLRTGIPRNPFNGSNTGTVGAIPINADGATGWYYNPDTGIIRVNAPGDDDRGIKLLTK